MPMRIFWLFLPIVLALSQEKPVALYPGTGLWKHPIQTKSPEAQKYFDQGLSLMYGFNRYEALRSFRKAAELDPEAPMAQWGIAMATGPYVNMDGDPTYDMKTSCGAAEHGTKLNIRSDRERSYLQAAATRCPEFKDPEAYVAAMRGLAERWPDDLDAATLFAESLMLPTRWHWYSNDGTAAKGMPEAERALEAVLRRWPDHPGANHLYIHAVESSRNPERAIPSAQRLMGITPGEGHMVHMPGHIWLVMGDWETAAVVNERAAEVDRQYFATTGVTEGSYPMYYVHNLHFIAYARTMQGRRADALKATTVLAGAIAPMAEAMPEMADGFTPVPWFNLIRFGEWDAILKLPQPKPVQKAATTFWHYARAMAFHGKSDRAAAERERNAFEEARKQVPSEYPWGQNQAGPVMALASEILAARISGDAVDHLKRAVELQDGLVYDEPPAWYYPVRESLGAALLKAGKAAEAETVFREGIRVSPRNGRMLFGLMEALKAEGKTEQAEWVRKEYEAVWARADIRLSLAEM
jgi:tetratricopeptide (TPR) repeat protein